MLSVNCAEVLLLTHMVEFFEQLLLNMNIGLLNSGAYTHYHSQTNSSSAIDLSLCSPELVPEFTWRVDNDLHGSDH